MRLICGVLQLDGADADDALVRAMAARMAAPRLGAQLRIWGEGPIALAVLDFAAPGGASAALPERGSRVMAADVRLDAPGALADAHGADSPEDALLLACAADGPAGVALALGDFAFACWDRDAQRLTCGRDAFGVRPLAYAHQSGRRFAFASLPQALWGGGVVPKQADRAALARQLARDFRHDDSLVAGIRRLPPAHLLEISREGFALSRYWNLDRAAIGAHRRPPDVAAGELRRLVDEAVRCRLPRAGEAGAHLSGGLDSSAIAILAARQLQGEARRLHAYAFLERPSGDVGLEDESAFVAAVVARQANIDCTPIQPPPGLRALDEPIDADKMTPLGREAPENAVCAHAERQGVRVILSGWGGDEAASFNGEGALAELLLSGRWRTLGGEIAALSRERGWPRAGIFRREVLGPLLAAATPGWVRAFVRRLRGAPPGDAARPPPFGAARRLRLITRPQLAHRLEIWAATGARSGLAFAFPLLDRRVVEYALSLPGDLYLRGGFRRRLFRDAMADVLPDLVRLRHQKFQPFPGSALVLAERKPELLARLEGYRANAAVRSFVDLDLLRRQIEAFPAPERMREDLRRGGNPTAPSSMIAVSQTLMVAEYLAQHGAPDGGVDGAGGPT